MLVVTLWRKLRIINTYISLNTEKIHSKSIYDIFAIVINYKIIMDGHNNNFLLIIYRYIFMHGH